VTARTVSRRRLVQAGAAALGASVVPAGNIGAVGADAAPAASGAALPAFNAAGYVQAFRSAGYAVTYLPPGRDGRATFCLGHGSRTGFGRDIVDLADRWGPEWRRHSDALDQVAAYLAAEAA